jgi:hypothetical protein
MTTTLKVAGAPPVPKFPFTASEPKTHAFFDTWQALGGYQNNRTSPTVTFDESFPFGCFS